MRPLSEFSSSRVSILFSDIDDTLTDNGKLGADAYSALWKLSESGIKVIPITGRPAGFCEMIARFWPVEAIIGENGAFYFSYKNKKMKRHFFSSPKQRQKNRQLLKIIRRQILDEVPGSAVSSDQFCRLFDLAIDYCEDVPPLTSDKVEKIKSIFESHGAQAKVSSIHVNGWFGDFDKLKMCQFFCKQELRLDLKSESPEVAFVGDSPNDEPMFSFFQNSFGVANVKKFSGRMQSLPSFVSESEGGRGFSQITEALLKIKP